jgi:hypothetical protein
MVDVAGFSAVAAADNHLCVLSTLRPGGAIQSSVVNAGVVAHPATGAAVIGVIAAATARKVVNLRADAHASVVARSGWEWVTVEGTAELVAGDGSPLGIDCDGVRALLRAVSAAAIGGAPDDWTAHVDALDLDGHVVVLVVPERIYAGAP